MQEIDAGAMHVQEVAPEAAVAGVDAEAVIEDPAAKYEAPRGTTRRRHLCSDEGHMSGIGANAPIPIAG